MSIDLIILGAGGYTGRELIRLLQKHPDFNPVHITSEKYAGKKLGAVFPELGNGELSFKRHGEALPSGLPVFLATPDEISLERVPELLDRGQSFVDLSGAFRLHDQEKWEEAYARKHSAFELTGKDNIVYALPELFRDKIKNAKALANPGCYPTSAILPLASLGELRKELLSISIHACSGISGAGGRVEGDGFAFTRVYENFRAYKILKHQHEAEIEEYACLGLEPAAHCPLSFTPHLLPVFRGILSTIVLHWKGEAPKNLANIFRDLAQRESFFRFYEEAEEVELSKVQKTNYLDLGLRSRASITVMMSALDNLVKGAAGQAIQNMNLMLELPESRGLL